MILMKLFNVFVTLIYCSLVLVIFGCSNKNNDPRKSLNTSELKIIDLSIGTKQYKVFLGNKIIKQTSEHRIWKKAKIINVFTIGGVDDTTLYSPSSVRTDKFGNIYVLDMHARSVKKFSRDGKLIRNFGKYGRGPGEFLSPFRFDVLPDGQLIVFDSRLAKFEIFNGDKSSQILSQGIITSLCFINMMEFSILCLVDPIAKSPIRKYNIIDEKYKDYQKILINTSNEEIDVGILPFLDGSIHNSIDGELFYFPLVMNHFTKYSKDGDVLFSRNTMDNIDFTSYRRDNYQRVGFQFQKEDITTFSSSIYKNKLYLLSMSAIRINKDKKEYAIDVYSTKNGNYLYSFRFNLLAEEKIITVHITDSKIYLLTTTTELKVFKYKI